MGAGTSVYFWTKFVGGRHFVIFDGRSESGAGSSGFLVDEMRVGKALRNFCWAKRGWGSLFGIIRARSVRQADTSGILVGEVSVRKAVQDFSWAK